MYSTCTAWPRSLLGYIHYIQVYGIWERLWDCARCAPATIFKKRLLKLRERASGIKESDALWAEEVSVLYSVLFDSDASFVTAVPDKLSPTCSRCAQASESAFICLWGLPRLSLAQRKEEGCCFYWPDRALPLTWLVFRTDRLPAGKKRAGRWPGESMARWDGRTDVDLIERVRVLRLVLAFRVWANSLWVELIENVNRTSSYLLLRGHSFSDCVWKTLCINQICRLKLAMCAQQGSRIFLLTVSYTVGTSWCHFFCPGVLTSNIADAKSARNMFTAEKTFLPANQEDGRIFRVSSSSGEKGDNHQGKGVC